MSDTEDWTIEIVCTDRGQHKRTWMTRFRWGGGGWTSVRGYREPSPKHDMFGPPDLRAEPGDALSRQSFGFACSRCSRSPKINRVRWIEI